MNSIYKKTFFLLSILSVSSSLKLEDSGCIDEEGYNARIQYFNDRREQALEDFHDNQERFDNARVINDTLKLQLTSVRDAPPAYGDNDKGQAKES